jgi:RNA polymerase sporulation-specific sigma factor
MSIGVVALLIAGLLQGFYLLTGYIGGNAFPLPLSAREERRRLEQMADGSEAARKVLIEHNLRLVAHVVKKFDSTGEDLDDLISIGSIGLIKAVDTFDPTKGVRLATYAARCIENDGPMTRCHDGGRRSSCHSLSSRSRYL